MKKDFLLEDFESRKLDNPSEVKGGDVPWYTKMWYGTTSQCTDYNYNNCTSTVETDYGAGNMEITSDTF